MYEDVKKFHQKYEFPVDVPLLSNQTVKANDSLKQLRDLLKHAIEIKEILSLQLMHVHGDPRLYRICNTLEEVTEQIEAMLLGDKVKLVDSIYDGMYFKIGTLVTFDLHSFNGPFPFFELWQEVQRSNMSKAKSDVNSQQTRRNKTYEYKPPQFKEILNGNHTTSGANESKT